MRDWLLGLPETERDAAVEKRLGIADSETASPGENLIGHHPSGVGAILEMIELVPITERDVLVDLGSGAGKVVLLVHLLTGARARGIELQPALVHRARAAAARTNADVRFDIADVRDASLDDASVIFLYLPFTGAALRNALERIRAAPSAVVCTLGLDLDVPWLRRRETSSFWLSIYDRCESRPGTSTR